MSVNYAQNSPNKQVENTIKNIELSKNKAY